MHGVGVNDIEKHAERERGLLEQASRRRVTCLLVPAAIGFPHSRRQDPCNHGLSGVCVHEHHVEDHGVAFVRVWLGACI